MLADFCASEKSSNSIQENYDNAIEAGVAPCVVAALDMALWDLRAKQARLPLYKLLGLSKKVVPTSVTVGINPPEVVRERIPLLLDGTGVKALKIKLGSPEGLDADQEMFSAVIEMTKNRSTIIRVDANGGWSVPDAKKMMQWLADRGVEYIEQPLKKGQEDDLIHLFKNRPLPIYVDESCRVSSDIPNFADRVDGVNLKLMKCGGITEALRIVSTARAFGLKTMIGCMGESSVSIAAGASIGSLFDYIDLDSHLNLDPDPCNGAEMTDGRILPSDNLGHGGSITNA
jgi:muconate cycloisomerase